MLTMPMLTELVRHLWVQGPGDQQRLLVQDGEGADSENAEFPERQADIFVLIQRVRMGPGIEPVGDFSWRTV